MEDHSRTIIHIDIDCFYAQVEMNKNETFRNVPLGVQQKNIIVTSNYKARAYGIGKCMLVTEARKLCPELVLANGEDLHDYRQVSYAVTNLLHKYTEFVERLGLDENFLDVSGLVAKRLKDSREVPLKGHIWGEIDCDCGCVERLKMGSVLADEIREAIRNELKLSTCAGIAHNKLLAKIVGTKHKPNDQTVIFPNSALELMLSLKSLNDIPGIGRAMLEQLNAIDVKTVTDLQDCDVKILEKVLGSDRAKFVKNLSYGVDSSLVKITGKPQSIGLEDSCRSISIEAEVKNKLQQLLHRLLILIAEDGRIPKTIKLTVRKFDKDTKISHRETKQSNINLSAFNSSQKEAKIMTTVMHLFNRIVDVKKPYHITLLGLSVTKFQEPPNTKHSIAAFLRKDLEVHSLTSFESGDSSFEDALPVTPSTSKFNVLQGDSPTPSPKKLKLSTKKRIFDDYSDCESPSKLKVADLSLESVCCPPDVDKEVFKELPYNVQKELCDEYKGRQGGNCGRLVKKTKPNTLLNYFIRNK